MKHTLLLTKILENAETVKNAFHSDHLWPSHIAVAFTDFCATEYTGFCLSDQSIYPNWYEEERLRLLYSKVLKNLSFFKLRLKKILREGGTEMPFDFSLCEKIASLRNNDVLSADLVFLCVLGELMPQCQPVFRILVDEDAIIPLLEYADANIYDYTAKSVEAVCKKLMEKATTAAAKRDWKPAAKFVEPDGLIQLALKDIQTTLCGNILTVKIPKFFGSSGLTLSIHCVDGIYYVHDHRCALSYLARTIPDEKKYARAVKKVCHNARIDRGRITGSFSNVYGFMYYLKDLIFVAQAELYYPKATKQLCFRDKGYVYIPQASAQPFEKSHLLDILKQSVDAYYDQDIGLCCWLKAGNSPFQTRYSFQVETLENGYIRLSDRLKGNYEGELLEPYYWYYEDMDISLYGKYFCRLSAHFGAEFDGKNFYLTVKSKDFQKGLFQFFQLSVLISRLGQDIALPKRKKK